MATKNLMGFYLEIKLRQEDWLSENSNRLKTIKSKFGTWLKIVKSYSAENPVSFSCKFCYEHKKINFLAQYSRNAEIINAMLDAWDKSHTTKFAVSEGYYPEAIDENLKRVVEDKYRYIYHIAYKHSKSITHQQAINELKKTLFSTSTTRNRASSCQSRRDCNRPYGSSSIYGN